MGSCNASQSSQAFLAQGRTASRYGHCIRSAKRNRPSSCCSCLAGRGAIVRPMGSKSAILRARMSAAFSFSLAACSIAFSSAPSASCALSRSWRIGSFSSNACARGTASRKASRARR
ncbi:hypothetical protein BDV12DRAFT_177367 [Aspergillus spectabilis]